jgi:DNA-binding winged helix-turn-helix (wHTH) protein
MAGAIDLAHAAPFRLGQVEVHPGTRQLIRAGKSETLEPRVMKVLVALAWAEGAILTRDELTQSCWGGRVVGENAIHRAISRLRDVALKFGGGSFQLETITKVGYRLIVPGAEPPASAVLAAEPAAPAIGRRRLLIGGSAAALGLAGAAAWFVNRPAAGHVPPGEALELYRQGKLLQRQGLDEQVKQAIAFFSQAVKIDPLYADAWGALALSYRNLLESYAEGQEASAANLARSAARRALALDRDNADAAATLILIEPHFRRWAEFEQDVRGLLSKHPDHWVLRSEAAHILYQVGRWEEGIEHGRKVLEIDPFLPMAHNSLARALWSAGRLQEAHSLIDKAVERWPAHYTLWNTKYNILAFSGRAAAAIAAFADPERPTFGVAPTAAHNRTVLARAIETGSPDDVAAALAIHRSQALAQVSNIPHSALVFAALGQADLTFEALDAYFFGRGPMVGAGPSGLGPYARRYTYFLFAPPMARVRSDPRFAALTAAIGLDDYWGRTNSVPDYRR